MNARSPMSRVWIVVALLGLVLVVPLGIQRVSASASAPTVAVLGDSITARYNNESGSQGQGWWSFVGKRYGVKVDTFAESGSGFQRPGNLCQGTTFGQRIDKLIAARPKVVFVEGGRNDWARCHNHRLVIATDAQIATGVNSVLGRLRSDLPFRTKFFVLGPPWGPRDMAQRDRVTEIVRTSAVAHGMTFISTTGAFNRSRVLDGTHPNRKGSIALGEVVIKAIGPTLIEGTTVRKSTPR